MLVPFLGPRVLRTLPCQTNTIITSFGVHVFSVLFFFVLLTTQSAQAFVDYVIRNWVQLALANNEWQSFVCPQTNCNAKKKKKHDQFRSFHCVYVDSQLLLLLKIIQTYFLLRMTTAVILYICSHRSAWYIITACGNQSSRHSNGRHPLTVCLLILSDACRRSNSSSSQIDIPNK